MVEFLLLDLDDTILDFQKGEEHGLRKTLLEAGIEPTEAICARYSVINKDYWKRLELGEVTRQQVMLGRFETLYKELGVTADPAVSAASYMDNMSSVHFFLPGAEEAVKSLAAKYRLFLVSNGTASAQHRRLTSAGLYPYFEKVFISQEVGYNKPAKEFFDLCFAQIPGFDPQKALIVGDSLSSDIQGGINAGIRTCWFNPHGNPGRPDIQPNYEIVALSELPPLLASL